MTCASCAARVEKKLNKLDGVTATVNFATETARVGFPVAVSVGDLISVVEQAGYTAALPARRVRQGWLPPDGGSRAAPPGGKHRRPRCGSGCWCRWRWLSRWWCWRWSRRCSSGTGSGPALALASPVVVWGAWPFHRAAVVNARHGAATMDTLISVGVAAAYLWSLYALFFGAAGRAGARMGFAWLARGSGAGATYLEVARRA